jgi:DNA replication protein DnaC
MRTDNVNLLSNDPRLAGLPDTPAPVICEFCGAERYTEGLNLLGTRIIWYPSGAQPCACPEGKAAYERKIAEDEARRKAEEKEKADREMRERVRRIIGESGMGERFLQRTFQTFRTETADQKKIKTAAQAYAGEFDAKLPKRGQPLPGRNGFIISGTKGTGKTHIAAAIANDLMSRGTAVICMTERNLLGKIRRTFSQDEHTDESAVRGIYERVPLLIIDDLGKEKPSEWTLATLYAIIDGRYEKAMPIIVTTNYDMKSLTDRLTPERADKTTADAIIDRMNEMCESIVMSGESWRGK